MDQTLAATLLFQLSEDFANIQRDLKVEKRSYFTSKSKRPFMERLNVLLKLGDQKFSKLSLNSFTKNAVKYAWVVRSLSLYLKASLSAGKWRESDLYDKCNKFEEINHSIDS